MVFLFFFFFSSRRRHTRWPRDWSSDVCSSDLRALGRVVGIALGRLGQDDQLGDWGAELVRDVGRGAALALEGLADPAQHLIVALDQGNELRGDTLRIEARRSQGIFD